jgi:predicted phosphoribosyltransferase
MDLFRDLLDAELLDKHKRRIGRVDGIVLDVREGRPPRVVTMEVGAAAVANRIHRGLGVKVQRLIARLLHVPGDEASIAMDAIRDIGVDVEVDVDAERDAQFLQTEKAVRRIVGRIPGGGK